MVGKKRGGNAEAMPPPYSSCLGLGDTACIRHSDECEGAPESANPLLVHGFERGSDGVGEILSAQIAREDGAVNVKQIGSGLAKDG